MTDTKPTLDDVMNALSPGTRLGLREAVFSIRTGDDVNLQRLADMIDRLLDGCFVADEVLLAAQDTQRDFEAACEKLESWAQLADDVQDMLQIEVDAFVEMNEPISASNVLEQIHTLKRDRPE